MSALPLVSPLTPTAGAAVPWRLWRDGARTPAENMAVDEALYAALAPGQPPLLRFYSWDRPAVSLGYFQRFDGAPASGYAVVRRPTGGGLVYHDRDLTFSLLAPAGHPAAPRDRRASYRRLNDAVRAALTACGLPATLAERAAPVPDRGRLVCFTTAAQFDVVLPAGKVAGGAQRRGARGLLHQASLDLSVCPGLTREPLIAALLVAFGAAFACTFAPYTPPPALLAAAARLAAGKYASERWQRRR